MEPQIVTGRLLVTLDRGKDNVGRVIESRCQGESRLMIPRVPEVVQPGEDPQPVPEMQWYDHIIFVKEMSDEVEIDGESYIGMSVDAILAVIPDG